MDEWAAEWLETLRQWAIVIGLAVLCVLFLHFGVARSDVTIFRHGLKMVWRLDSWRARRWFKKHFAGEVVNNRIVFDPDREQEMRDRIYAIGRREGPTGFWFSTAPDEL
jgi:hypothetical protein